MELYTPVAINMTLSTSFFAYIMNVVSMKFGLSFFIHFIFFQYLLPTQSTLNVPQLKSLCHKTWHQDASQHSRLKQILCTHSYNCNLLLFIVLNSFCSQDTLIFIIDLELHLLTLASYYSTKKRELIHIPVHLTGNDKEV